MVLALGGSLFATSIARSPALAFVASHAVGIALAGAGALVAVGCRR